MNLIARAIHWVLLTGLPFGMTGCVAPVHSLFPPKPGEARRTVYLVTQGPWHTGIALRRADVPAGIWVAKDDYPDAKYIEVGWGDSDGYRKKLTPWIVTKGLFWPTHSVLQLDGFTNSVEANFADPRATIVAVDLSVRGFERLCQHIACTHELDEAGRPRRLGDDWYDARGKYCICWTCNTWLAKGLRAAGCPIVSWWCLTRGPLIRQARRFGRVVHEPGTDCAVTTPAIRR